MNSLEIKIKQIWNNLPDKIKVLTNCLEWQYYNMFVKIFRYEFSEVSYKLHLQSVNDVVKVGSLWEWRRVIGREGREGVSGESWETKASFAEHLIVLKTQDD